MTTKNPKPLSEARDADARNSMAAMIRAAQKARQLSEQTQTPFVTRSNTANLVSPTPKV